MMGEDRAGTDWEILLEAADDRGCSTLAPADLRRLMAAWSGVVPTTLYSPNRYALQVTVRAADPPTALGMAMSLWTDALVRASLPAWELVRAEVLTPGELKRELLAVAGHEEASDALCASTSERALADDLLRRALHDTVTGLPNRELFVDEVRQTLSTPLVGSEVRAVVVVALDREHGRELPNDLLTDIATRLTAVVRQGDSVARVGPTEFAALVTFPCGDHTDGIAERVLATVRAAVNRQGRSVAASVGVAIASSGDDPDHLMVMAAAAMGTASATGANCHRHLAGRRGRFDHDDLPPA